MPVRAVQELQLAVEQEDYARAAELRDSGCAGLLGWWHSRAEDDPVGHILRIAPDFGRYTAVKYTAQDLAELKVLSESSSWICIQFVGWLLAIGGSRSESAGILILVHGVSLHKACYTVGARPTSAFRLGIINTLWPLKG